MTSALAAIGCVALIEVINFFLLLKRISFPRKKLMSKWCAASTEFFQRLQKSGHYHSELAEYLVELRKQANRYDLAYRNLKMPKMFLAGFLSDRFIFTKTDDDDSVSYSRLMQHLSQGSPKI
jgi:hypothetical protein